MTSLTWQVHTLSSLRTHHQWMVPVDSTKIWHIPCTWNSTSIWNQTSWSVCLAHLISHSTVSSSDTAINSPKTFPKIWEKLPELYGNFRSYCTGTKLLHLRLCRAGCLHQNEEQLPLKTGKNTPSDWAHLSTVDTEQHISVFMVKKIYCILLYVTSL